MTERFGPGGKDHADFQFGLQQKLLKRYKEGPKPEEMAIPALISANNS